MIRTLRRAAVVASATTALLGLAPAISWAAGTGGIDLTPVPAVSSSGTPVTAFHTGLPAGGRATERFDLRNLTGRTATIALYAAAVDRSPGGAFVVGRAGSAPWVSLPAQTVTLGPHAQRLFTFTVSRARAPHGTGTLYAAIVLQHAEGTIVERAATLVYLDRLGPDLVGRALPPVVAAFVLLAAVGALFLRNRRRRPGGPVPPPAPAKVRQLAL